LKAEHKELKKNYEDLKENVGKWERQLAECIQGMYSFRQLADIEIRIRDYGKETDDE
jgi:hypothetical protein